MKSYKEHAQDCGYVAQQSTCDSKWFWYNDRTEQLSQSYFTSEDQAYEDATYVSLLKQSAIVFVEED